MNNPQEVIEMASDSDEALAIISQLMPHIKRAIQEETADCVRRGIMQVKSLPSDGLIGVSEPYGKEIKVRYVTGLTFAIGDSVIVHWSQSKKNLVVVGKVGEYIG